MEPRVQYVKTPDGVNLAYYEMGEGVPFVFINMPFSHLTAEWKMYGPVFAGIAANYRLVRFDPRGFGLSDRSPRDLSLAAHITDLETIFNRLELPAAILNANVVATAVGIAYAARYPQQLTHLVLVEAAARATEVVREQMKAAFGTGADWRFVSEALMRFIQGWDRPEESAAAAALLRESVTLEDAQRFIDSYLRWDLADTLPHVTTPTLVVNSKSNPWAGIECGREVAAALPNGHLVVTGEQPSANPVLEQVLAVRSFLRGEAGVEPLPATKQSSPGVGTMIILFADIVDSTALTERVGDAAFRERARALDASLRGIITSAGGTAIEGKLLGDGVLATFPAAAQAIDAALRCGAAGDDGGLPLHLGIHAGDVIRESNNVFGGAVNVASRISGLSAPGELLVSEVVRALARTSASVTFEDRGEHVLKGVGEPQRVYAVRASRSRDGGGG